MPSKEYTAKELKIKELKIEQNIPLIERYPHGAFTSLVRKMGVGDSIFCTDSKQVTGITTTMTRLGMSYQTRKEGRGRRVWRNAK